jgi:hypothetical protein
LTPDRKDNQKILLTSWVVKEKIAFGNSLGFQARIEDLHLKCGILGDGTKNKTSGRSPRPGDLGEIG